MEPDGLLSFLWRWLLYGSVSGILSRDCVGNVYVQGIFITWKFHKELSAKLPLQPLWPWFLASYGRMSEGTRGKSLPS
jgi:hypothetical protein